MVFFYLPDADWKADSKSANECLEGEPSPT